MAQDTMGTLDELLKRHDELTQRIQGMASQYPKNQKTEAPKAAYTPPASGKSTSLSDELDAMFANDPSLSALLNNILDESPKPEPYKPKTLDEIINKAATQAAPAQYTPAAATAPSTTFEIYSTPVTQPAPATANESPPPYAWEPPKQPQQTPQPPVSLDAESFFTSSTPEPKQQQAATPTYDYSQQPSPEIKNSQAEKQTATPFMGQADWFVEKHRVIEKYKNKDRPQETALTDKQLRALGRKHLLQMILDLETELRQTKGEMDQMIFAYQAGLARQPRTG